MMNKFLTLLFVNLGAGGRSSSSNPQGTHKSVPGGVVRVYTDSSGSKLVPGSFIPYCSMAQAQLSFHGHRDPAKFFVAVPGMISSIRTTEFVKHPSVKPTYRIITVCRE
jgi:hypothetical protein